MKNTRPLKKTMITYKETGFCTQDNRIIILKNPDISKNYHDADITL